VTALAKNNKADAEEELCRLQAEFCKGMAHPKRILILNLLKDGEKSVNALVALTGISQSNISQHLSFMRRIGILQSRREGLNICYSIADYRITEACELVRKAIGERVRRNRAVLQIAR
jgi:ArsR family transcriptional regulator